MTLSESERWATRQAIYLIWIESAAAYVLRLTYGWRMPTTAFYPTFLSLKTQESKQDEQEEEKRTTTYICSNAFKSRARYKRQHVRPQKP